MHTWRFLSTLSLRRATVDGSGKGCTSKISIHALLAESDNVACGDRHKLCISIHALLAESDPVILFPKIPVFDFYPRSPCGERPPRTAGSIMCTRFLSTLSLRRATGAPVDKMPSSSISIHALLAESDTVPDLGKGDIGISIHALLAESDAQALSVTGSESQFLSTLSLRRATAGNKAGAESFKFLSTLSLRRATFKGDHGHIKGDISIHALLAESDTSRLHKNICGWGFLSTLSLRRATVDTAIRVFRKARISIHALLAESDLFRVAVPQHVVVISIHALLAESDVRRLPWQISIKYFYPRSPCGERRIPGPAGQHGFDFYPRSPCGERRSASRYRSMSS